MTARKQFAGCDALGRRNSPVSALLLWGCLWLAGCGSPGQRTDLAAGVAATAGFARADVPGGPFTLATWSRLTDPTAPLTVYIEGDGLAWLTPIEVSSDPTPSDPLALRLAAADPAPNLVYIARPCQFRPPAGSVACSPTYWTDRLFAPEVIRSVDAVIGRFAADTRGGVRLVGYSGGGAVAVLIAARRSDVIDLRTVAGNIDTAAFVEHHHVTPYGRSLDPADVAAELTRMPQIHFVGENDIIVPGLVAAAYARRAGDSPCLAIVPVAGVSHARGWIEAWPQALLQRPACR